MPKVALSGARELLGWLHLPAMQDERPLALAVVVACAIGLFSVLLTELVLRSGASRRLASAVPPELKCFVSGLLSGLGLLVMLPLALDQLTAAGWPYEHILLAFLAGPLATFFVNHVMLDHQHADDPSAAPHSHGRRSDGTQILCGQAAPAKFTFGGAPQLVCQVSGRNPEALADEESAGAAWADKLSVVCGAVPFTIHAAVDGSILGTAHSPVLLASLALPITLCAVQDVATIVPALSASRASEMRKSSSSRARFPLLRCSLSPRAAPLGARSSPPPPASVRASPSAPVCSSRSPPRPPPPGPPSPSPPSPRASSCTWRCSSLRRRTRMAARRR